MSNSELSPKHEAVNEAPQQLKRPEAEQSPVRGVLSQGSPGLTLTKKIPPEPPKAALVLLEACPA